MPKLYTDGASSYKRGLYGSGYVIVENDEEVYSASIKGKYPQFVKYNNVAGEIFACLYGIEKCVELGYESVEVYVDYIGLIKWRSGAWRAKNELSKAYISTMRHLEQHIDINFNKVRGHSGDFYNERADDLATSSIN